MTQSLAVWPEAAPSIVAPVAEHEELRDVVRQLLDRHADHQAVRHAADSPRGWSDERRLRLNKELDVGSMIVPEERGGSGFGLRDLAVVLEETGAALLPEPVLESSVLTALTLSLADDQHPAEGAVDVMVRPEQIVLSPAQGIEASVCEVTFLGRDRLVVCELRDAHATRVRARVPGYRTLHAGNRVRVAVDGEVCVYSR